jgi:hypothetical protein
MIALVASFANLVGPDLIVIALIIAVLAGVPAVIALVVLFIILKRGKKPPPLPSASQPPA